METDFEVRGEAEGYPLLVSIDATGTVYVIYPYDQSEIRRQPAGMPLRLPEVGEAYDVGKQW